MTPQPPKPAMHDIVIGNWNAGPQNTAASYSGAIFGPTSLIINNECNGEDAAVPGGGGENRRIKAFKWFTKYFGVSPGADNTLSCKCEFAFLKQSSQICCFFENNYKKIPSYKCLKVKLKTMLPFLHFCKTPAYQITFKVKLKECFHGNGIYLKPNYFSVFCFGTFKSFLSSNKKKYSRLSV